jgi:putative ABC transport system permease protein
VIRLFLRGLAAHFRAGRTLFLLTAFGVALGVASVLSIQILNRSALGAFEGAVRAVSGEADLSVLPRGPSIPDEAVRRVLAVPGVQAAWPMVRYDVAVDDRPEVFLEVVGIDLLAPLELPWDVPAGEIAAALGEIGWTAVTPEMAADLGWSAGDRVAVSWGSRRQELLVGALVDFRRVTPTASRRLAVMDLAQAQGLFGRRDELAQIDVKAAPGVRPDELAARIEAALGPVARAETPEARRARTEGLLGAFRLNLTALSLISLLVGMFLVYTSTQASLVRRRREFGLLRSTGASRAQVLSLILGEVAILGLLGVAVGVPLGFAVARANVATVSGTLTNLYLLQGIEQVQLPPALLLLSAGVGIGGAIAGALLPALDMSRRDTRTLLAAYTLHERVGASAVTLAIWGMALMTLTVVWHNLQGRHLKEGGFVLGLALLAAIPLLAPLAVKGVAGVLRVRSFSLAYGLKAMGRRVGTTAFAVAALAVAVSMLTGITVMVGSFRYTLEVWIDSTIRADVYVTSVSWDRSRMSAGLEPEIVEALERRPGVAEVDRLRRTFSEIGGRRVSVIGVDLAVPGAETRFAFLAGDRDEAYRRAREEGAVLVGEPLARREGLRVGSTLRLVTPQGETSAPVAGIYYDYGSEIGSVATDLEAYERLYGPGPPSNLAIYLEPGRDAEAEVDRLKASFAGEPLVFRSNRLLREEVFAIFDQTFAVTRLLRAMSLIIAVAGVMLTLLILARERVSELALYRALGADRSQIFRVFLGKGLGMAALGLAIGSIGGAVLAFLLIFVINRAYFGWTLAFHGPWGALALQAAALLAAAALASLYPAGRASATPATELSRDDL